MGSKQGFNWQSPSPQPVLNFYQSSYANPVASASAAPQSAPPGSGQGATPGASGGYGGEGRYLSTGWLAAFGTGGYPDEPPLLEELGINFEHIKSKTLTVLNPLVQVDQHIMDDSDLAGPILFCLLFGTFLLLSGKVHFGYIYGVALLGTISLHLILNLMSENGLRFTRTASVLGYCLLPLVLISAVGVLLSIDSIIGYGLSTIAIVWCTYSASSMFIAVLQLTDMRFLVMYPVGLFYCIFAILSVFNQKGTIEN